MELTPICLLPQPPPPGLYVTLGPRHFIPWALESITVTLAYPSRIVWVDAANAFNAYLVGIAARSALKDPTDVLRSFQVARPFTAYQLETMIDSKTLPAVQKARALFAVIADPLRLFADVEGRDTQVQQCFDRFIVGVRRVASEIPVLVLCTKSQMQYSLPLFQAATTLSHVFFTQGRPIVRSILPAQALAIP